MENATFYFIYKPLIEEKMSLQKNSFTNRFTEVKITLQSIRIGYN